MLEVDSMNVDVANVDSRSKLDIDLNVNSELNIVQNKKNTDIYYITLPKVDTIHDIEMWDVKGNYDFSEKQTKNDTPYLSIQHNLNYHYNLKQALENFENDTRMNELVENVKETFLMKANEDNESEFYLTAEELNNIRYKSMIYSNGNVSKLYFSSIYKLFKNETEMGQNTYQHIPRIYVGEEPMFFDNLSKFTEFVENRTCSYKLNIYFKLVFNKRNLTVQYNPYIYSMYFPYEPYFDTSVRQFNNYSDETRLKILSDIIEEGLSNIDSLTSGSIPMIFFKNCIFKMSNIDMRNFTDLFGKQFHPKFYGGKNTKYDPNSNAKESLNIIADDEIQQFVKNIETVLRSYASRIKETLLTLKKEKKINIKLQKKDDPDDLFKMPISTHREIVESTDSEDEEIRYVEDGLTVSIFNIKQSSSSEENSWLDVPARRVNYTIRSPYIFLNKLWYNNTDNCIQVQFSFSKKLNIILHENKNMEVDNSLQQLMEEFSK